MMRNRFIALFLIILLVFFLGIVFLNLKGTEDYLYISLEKAINKKVLINNYQVGRIPASQIALKRVYSYQIPENNSILGWFSSDKEKKEENSILLLKTNQNLEKQGIFFALDNKGTTGNIFASDSTYAIVLNTSYLTGKDSLKLYLFKIGKEEGKYSRTLADSILLYRE